MNPFRQALQAAGAIKGRFSVGNREPGKATFGIFHAGTYPDIHAGWPNRATRRAVKGNRFSRLSAEWRQVLQTHPKLIPAIKGL